MLLPFFLFILWDLMAEVWNVSHAWSKPSVSTPSFSSKSQPCLATRSDHLKGAFPTFLCPPLTLPHMTLFVKFDSTSKAIILPKNFHLYPEIRSAIGLVLVLFKIKVFLYLSIKEMLHIDLRHYIWKLCSWLSWIVVIGHVSEA